MPAATVKIDSGAGKKSRQLKTLAVDIFYYSHCHLTLHLHVSTLVWTNLLHRLWPS